MYNLRIDAKYNRLYLGNSVIQDLGNPEFIQMWIRPSDMTIVFSGAGTGLRIKQSPSGEFCLYSKALLRDMKHVCGERLRDDSSYRLRGTKLGAGIYFSMSTMERIQTDADNMRRE